MPRLCRPKSPLPPSARPFQAPRGRSPRRPAWIECRGLATPDRRQASSTAPGRRARRAAGAGRLPDPRPRRARELHHAEVRRLAERRSDLKPLQDHPVHRRGRVRGRRGRAPVLGLQVPGEEERGRGPDPRQHAARDRLDGRGGADPGGADGGHVREAPGDHQPAELERQRLPLGVADRRPTRRTARSSPSAYWAPVHLALHVRPALHEQRLQREAARTPTRR